MEGGLERPGRIPGVELGPGVESPLGVGVLDFSPGVPALSRWWKRHGSGRLDIVKKKLKIKRGGGGGWRFLPTASLWT